MMARGFHRGGLIAWETTKQAGDRAEIAGCEVVFPECMGSVGEADLDPHRTELRPGSSACHNGRTGTGSSAGFRENKDHGQ